MGCSACQRVAYCNQTCQKAHWRIHKPVCHAAAKENQDSDEDEAEDEAEDEVENDSDAEEGSEDQNEAEGEKSNVKEVSKDASDDLAVGDEANPNATNPVATNPNATNPNFTNPSAANPVTSPQGTYIEWFTIPTPTHPDGYKTRINLNKTMVVFLASLPEKENRQAEWQLVYGHKLGLEPLKVFRQIVKGKGKKLRSFQQRADNPATYAVALQTLAGRHTAATPRAVGTAMKPDSRIVRLDKCRGFVFSGTKNEIVTVGADLGQVLELDEDEDGEVEVVLFDADTVANMKYLHTDEKEEYKKMLAHREFEQRYPGKTMAEVAADKKNQRALAKEQESVEDGLAAVDLDQ